MARVLAGEEELEENHVGELEGLFFLVRDVVGEDAGSGEPVVPVVDAAGARRARAATAAARWLRRRLVRLLCGTSVKLPTTGVLGIDPDGDNIPGVSLAGMISGRPGGGDDHVPALPPTAKPAVPVWSQISTTYSGGALRARKPMFRHERAGHQPVNPLFHPAHGRVPEWARNAATRPDFPAPWRPPWLLCSGHRAARADCAVSTFRSGPDCSWRRSAWPLSAVVAGRI